MVYILVYMRRTNIYLDEHQARWLDQAARTQGISRAALIRRLLDRGLNEPDADLETDLAAIESSFGVLSDGGEFLVRGPDERSRHLDDSQ